VGLLGLISEQLVSGRRAAADSAPVPAGSAIASASVLGAVPIVGNTNLAVSVGDSLASYQDDEGRASSQTLDLGGLGVILANTPFCGTIVLPANDQPQPLDDDTVGGTPTESNNSQGAGVEEVTEDPSPESASATTTPVGQVIPGLVTVGGSTNTTVDYVAGSEREARASALLQLDLAGGLVDLQGMSWSATQHSGTAAVSQGAFSVASIKVGGVTVPALTPAELATATGLVNQALSPLGMMLVLPAVTTDPATGTVTVSPLQITVGHSALSNVIVSPLVREASSLEAIVDGQTQSGSDCSNVKELEGNLLDSPETVANVALGTFGPGGGFDLDVGGVTADTQPPPSYADPFGVGGGSVAGGALPPSLLGSSGSVASLPPAAPFPSPATTAPTSAPSPAPAQAAPPERAVLATAAHCETTSPAGHPGCWSGDATVVGAAAVVGGAALFLADVRKSRRSRRRHTEEAAA
jgi:hypothetical protein